MITKQQIQDSNDGQQLAAWAANYCMGWENTKHDYGYIKRNKHPDADEWIFSEHWQPHQPTEKGKSQAIDLAEKYDLEIEFSDKYIGYKDYTKPVDDRNYSWWGFVFDNWQIAVLKAALLSAIGDSDE